MTFDPHAAVLLVLTAGIGCAMTVAGVWKNALEWRRRDRVCPSCGRLLKSCRCS